MICVTLFSERKLPVPIHVFIRPRYLPIFDIFMLLANVSPELLLIRNLEFAEVPYIAQYNTKILFSEFLKLNNGIFNGFFKFCKFFLNGGEY